MPDAHTDNRITDCETELRVQRDLIDRIEKRTLTDIHTLVDRVRNLESCVLPLPQAEAAASCEQATTSELRQPRRQLTQIRGAIDKLRAHRETLLSRAAQYRARIAKLEGELVGASRLVENQRSTIADLYHQIDILNYDVARAKEAGRQEALDELLVRVNEIKGEDNG